MVQVGGGGTPTPTPHPGPGLCQADADTFCALNGDFKIEVSWETTNGETGVGRVVTGATSDNTGIFEFFEAGNWELLLKVLDACAVNGHFWVFGGAATNVKYQIRVTDLVTDEVWTYDNPQGKRSDAITDTQAFATCSVDRSLMRENAPRRRPTGSSRGSTRSIPTTGCRRRRRRAASPTPSPTPVDVGPATPNATTLCTISERFQVRVSWTDEERQHRQRRRGAGLSPTTPASSGSSSRRTGSS